jgi:hypothetical protein
MRIRKYVYKTSNVLVLLSFFTISIWLRPMRWFKINPKRRPRLLSLLLAVFCGLGPMVKCLANNDPCLGPSFQLDLQKEMLPPIDNQREAPWCAVFAVKAILDYNIHIDCEKRHAGAKGACPYSPANRISAEDISAQTADAVSNLRGSAFYLGDGDIELPLLEGPQKGGVLTDKDLPFNERLFADNPQRPALIAKLRNYYEVKDQIAQTGGSCKLPSYFDDLETLLPGIGKLVEGVIASNGKDGEGSFLDNVSEKYYPIPPQVQAKRKPFVPPYNVFDFNTHDEVAYNSHIFSTLSAGQPLIARVCYSQLQMNAKLPYIPIQATDGCGGHAMTIIGLRKTSDGACQVHLRNSWGDHWPQGGDGTDWVSTADLWKSLNPNDGVQELVSIEPRSSSEPISNKYYWDKQYTFTGYTWNTQMLDGEIVDAHGNAYRGHFNGGALSCGVAKQGNIIVCVHPNGEQTPTNSMDPANCGCSAE